MRIKSVLIGAVAALVAVAGARAGVVGEPPGEGSGGSMVMPGGGTGCVPIVIQLEVPGGGGIEIASLMLNEGVRDGKVAVITDTLTAPVVATVTMPAVLSGAPKFGKLAANASYPDGWEYSGGPIKPLILEGGPQAIVLRGKQEI